MPKKPVIKNLKHSNKPYLNRNEEPQLQLSYCAFLDILGFKEMVFSAKDQDALFNSFIQTFENEVETIRGKNNLGFDFTPNWSVATFSDNIAIGMPFYSEDGESELGHIIGLAASYQLSMAMKGMFVRGAITTGDLFIGNNMVYGKPLINAYLLESEKARDPRIILDETCTKLISTHLQFYREPFDSPQNKDLLIDLDGMIFINYLDELVFSDDEEFTIVWEKVLDHKNQVEKKLEAYSKNPVVWAKYNWVANYHNYFCSQYEGYSGFAKKYLVDDTFSKRFPNKLVDRRK